MLTYEPNTDASYYTCGWCGISAQDLVPVTDGDGNQLVADDGVIPIMVNDEAAASAELTEHASEHAGEPLPLR